MIGTEWNPHEHGCPPTSYTGEQPQARENVETLLAFDHPPV